MNSKTGTPEQVSVQQVVKRFLLIFLILVALVSTIIVIFAYQEIKNKGNSISNTWAQANRYWEKGITETR